MGRMSSVAAQALPDRLPTPVRAPHHALRIALLAMLAISVMATAVSIAAFFMVGAVVAAVFALALYAAIVALRVSRPVASSLDDLVVPDDAEVHEVAPDLPVDSIVAERAEWRLALAVAAPLILGALLLGGFLLDWRVAGLGALAFFALMVLMGAPVWLAAVED